MSNTKTALLSGITGQTGSYMADFLLEKGYKVYGLCRRSSTVNDERIRHLQGNGDFELVSGDLTDAVSIARIVTLIKPDELYNFGAQSHVAVSFQEPLHTFEATGKSVLNVLEAIRTCHPSCKMVQSSSSEMFGSSYSKRTVFENHQLSSYILNEDFSVAKYEEAHTEKYQDENTPMHPQSPYAIAKLMGHHAVNVYRKSYGIFACSSIAMNHESPRRGENFVTRKITKYIGGLVNYAMTENGYNKINLNSYPKLSLGNIESYRDWGHAYDVVRANWMMLQHEKADDYLVATGKSYTVKEFLDLAFAHVNLDWKDFIVIDPKLFRPAEVDYLKGDASKIRTILGWEPKISFKQLVKDMVEHDVLYGKA